MRELIEESGLKTEEEVKVRLEENLKREGYNVEFDADKHTLNVSS